MQSLPLFPLQTVLFPDGVLKLRVFEARYLDLVSQALRSREPFGVIGLKRGTEVRGGAEPVELEAVGTLASIADIDAEQPGILKVECRGGQRFRLEQPTQREDGLWQASVALIAPDEMQRPPAELQAAAAALANAITALQRQGQHPFAEPFRLDDAGWVANRWCEILPISQAAKQRLMELTDPAVRLKLVDEYLRGKGVL